MNIHEYQGKELLRRYGVAVLDGHVAWTAEEAVAAAKNLPGPVYVVKSQIHAGGRGAGRFKEDPNGKGGVRVVKSEAAKEAAAAKEKAEKEAAKAAKEAEAVARRQEADALRDERADRARRNDSILGRIKNSAINTATRSVVSELTRGLLGGLTGRKR